MDGNSNSEHSSKSLPHFSIAALMQLTADCAIAASLGWLIGYVASVLLMIASIALTFRQGLVAIIVMAGLVLGVYAGPLSKSEASRELALAISFGALFLFALVRVLIRLATFATSMPPCENED